MVKGISSEKCSKVLTILVLRYRTFETSLTPFPLSLRQFQKPAKYLMVGNPLVHEIFNDHLHVELQARQVNIMLPGLQACQTLSSECSHV